MVCARLKSISNIETSRAEARGCCATRGGRRFYTRGGCCKISSCGFCPRLCCLLRSRERIACADYVSNATTNQYGNYDSYDNERISQLVLSTDAVLMIQYKKLKIRTLQSEAIAISTHL